MLRRFIKFSILLLILSSPLQSISAQGQVRVGGRYELRHQGNKEKETRPLSTDLFIERTRRLIEDVRAASYPELEGADIEVKTFNHEADYFRTGFSFSRLLLIRKMRFIIKVNPKVFELGAPEEALRAIIAHELGHVLYFKNRNRTRLFGLVRLISKAYTARFERWTDLQAISRGYSEGLKAYREWLYKNIPVRKLEEKRRNYFSPEEIDALKIGIARRPGLLDYWFKNVPRNLKQIEEQSKSRK